MRKLILIILLTLTTCFSYADTIKVQVCFTRTYKGAPYNDALWFDSLGDYNAKSPQEIQQMEDDRFNNWVYETEHPNTPQDIPTE